MILMVVERDDSHFPPTTTIESSIVERERRRSSIFDVSSKGIRLGVRQEFFQQETSMKLFLNDS